MNLGEAFVGEFLAHYASEYYDPAKAREYYLKTRELKGKQSTSDLTVKYQTKGKRGGTVTKINEGRTEERKQAWAYAKNQIGEAKKAELKNLSESNKETQERLRETARQKREEIGQKLTGLFDLLTKQKTSETEKIEANAQSALERVEAARVAASRKIREEAERKIDALPPVPEGVRGPARERLVAIRARKIAKINGDAAVELSSVANDAATERETISADASAKQKELSSKTKDQKATERESASANREKVANELKATVEKARADYEAGKERLIADYEARQQQEFDAIRTRV